MIGPRLRALRVDAERWAGRSPTLADVASELGVDESTVSRWETGRRSIPASVLPRWLALLAASPGERARLLEVSP